MLFEQPQSNYSFRRWLRKEGENRLLLKWCGIAIVMQFVIFKFLYPYPNFMPPDSYSYLRAAFYNQTINVWPIGYSFFLRLVSCFSASDMVLVWLQYLLLEASLLYFLFSIRYLMGPEKWLFRVLLAVTILNPLVPHISNFVGSDTLFTALSLVWFTQLCWMLYRPRRRLMFWHAGVLLLVFMTRYNAMYYPVVSVFVIFASRIKWKEKWIGVGAIILLLGWFVAKTEYAFHKESGNYQFSAFGGWQLASNALFAYAHAQPDSPSDVPPQFRELHLLVNHHLDSLSRIMPALRPDNDIGIYYLWDFKSPLRVYMKGKSGGDSSQATFLKRWSSLAPLYAGYGQFLIRRHPGLFIRYYLWPNLVKFCTPPTGFMGYYNIGENYVDPMTVVWFKWRDNRVQPRFKSMKINLAKAFITVSAAISFLFVVDFIGFGFSGGFKRCSVISKRILYLAMAVWLCNMVFGVLAAPIELRFLLFPMTVSLVILGLLLAFLVRESRTAPAKQEPGQRVVAGAEAG